MMTNEQARQTGTQIHNRFILGRSASEGPGFRFCIPITSTGPTILVPGAQVRPTLRLPLANYTASSTVRCSPASSRLARTGNVF